ncbi:hypothetical protein [Liquorilactobacillus mali]|nr:hypothetical protein [Liquorilactobacillus mali]MDN7145374.1 hypothetical protein [Liquorilactobacillus mali]
MVYKVDTESTIKEVMKQRACTYEEAVAFLIQVVKKQESDV